MRITTPRLFLSIALAATLSCGPSTPKSTQPTMPGDAPPAGDVCTSDDTSTPAPASNATLADVGLDAAAMNTAADPCTDFYEYTCGQWLEATEIPADKSRWSRGFSEIQERNQAELKTILTAAAAYSGDDPVTTAVGAYYGACMDEAAIEKAGLSGIAPALAQARKVRRYKHVAKVVSELHAWGIHPVFSAGAEQDFKDPTKVIGFLSQGGLGLPDRDYYLKDDDKSVEIRAAYAAHVERMFGLTGAKARAAKQAATDVMALETELAKISRTRVEMRNPAALYNKVDRAGLEQTAPTFDWKRYFKTAGVPDVVDISITSEAFFAGFDKLLKTQKPRVWSNYLQWTILRETASTLPKAFVDEAFTMASTLSGQQEQEVRWKRCAKATDGAVPDYVSQAYIKTMFSPQAKAAVEMMVAGIRKAFTAEVQTYAWMDEATKTKAVDKAKRMAFLIGYPDKWKNYDFALNRASYTANMLAASKYTAAFQWSKVGKPVDRGEWLMSSATVNAYYHPLRNHMVYPAGILQPPFFSPKGSVAVNLGGLGMVVGHELTHGFDDQGSKFAADGSFSNWWSPEVGDKFKKKTQCVVQQYAEYEALPGLALNGELTLGENIADMGGVKLAYLAYRDLRKGASDPIVADGYTEDQQFFLAVGQAWCSKSRDEIARVLVQTDPHSPPKFRVNGALANVPEFSDAFSCDKGTPMNRENMCAVW